MAIAGNSLNIVHYVPGIRLEQGGVVRAILDWCAVFAQRGHNVTLITYQGNDIPARWFQPGPDIPHVITLPAPTLPGRPLSQEALRLSTEAIRNAHIIHLHAPWLDGNRQIGKLARRLGVPYIVTVHGMLDDWAMNQRAWKKKLYLTLFGRRFLDNAALVHCTADGELSQAAKWFNNPTTAVLPCLIDLNPFEQLPGPDAGLSLLPLSQRMKPKILFLSRLHEKKGVDVLIRAAARLRDGGTQFVLLIAGNAQDDYEHYLRELSQQLNLNDNVVFLGLVTGMEKISLYQSADLFVLPTRQENFGLVLIEALAAGTPVVTTKGTDIWPEIKQAGGTIVDTTPESIAAAITDLLSRRSDLSALGQRGREWAMNTFAVEPLAQKYEALYRSVARSK